MVFITEENLMRTLEEIVNSWKDTLFSNLINCFIYKMAFWSLADLP